MSQKKNTEPKQTKYLMMSVREKEMLREITKKQKMPSMCKTLRVLIEFGMALKGKGKLLHDTKKDNDPKSEGVAYFVNNHDMQNLCKLCGFYGKQETEVMRNLIYVCYDYLKPKWDKHPESESSLYRTPEQSELPLEVVTAQGSGKSGNTKRNRTSPTKHCLMTEQEYELAQSREFVGNIPFCILREHRYVKSKKATVKDFEEKAEQIKDRNKERRMRFIDYRLTPDDQAKLTEICEFYGKSESAVIRHLLYSDEQGKYNQEYSYEITDCKTTAKDIVDLTVQEGIQSVSDMWEYSGELKGHERIDALSICFGELNILKMMLYELNIEDVLDKESLEMWRKYYDVYYDAVETAYRTGEYKAIVL